MGKEADGIIILIILFVIVGLSWDSIKESRQVQIERGSSSIGRQTELDEEHPADLVEQLRESQQRIENIQKNLEEISEEANRSVYYGKVRMSGRPANLNDPDPSREYITLTNNLDKGRAVNITGWIIVSERSGNNATIGRASTLPFPHDRKYESDVILGSGDSAYIVKGFSPIGISFRTNICTGYFEEHRTFDPPIPRLCPDPEDENLPRFSHLLDREDECLDLISRLRRCTTYGNEYIRDLPDTVTKSCKDYITTKINYNTCVANHAGDTDFAGNEWYVYLNRFGPLWRTKRESIKLYDREGKIVDEANWEN